MDQKYGGFWGRILRVNLTTGTTSVEEPDPKVYRQYMGGNALALYYLLKEMPAQADPLGPENRLILMTSPTVGCSIAGQARHTALAKSPLTGGLADSQSGGWWGAELKFAGWDGIIIEGQAKTPVYLVIEDEKAELCSADHIWGKTTGDAEEILHEAHPGKARILQIGPAGEKLVRFAMLTCDLRHFHGRGGLGAVMGSKKLRAIVVRGSNRKLKIADPDALKECRSWFNKGLKDHVALQAHQKYGTPRGVVPLNSLGILPSYNFQDGSFDGAEKICGETMAEEIGVGSETCYACGVACKRLVEGKKGKFKVTRRYGGPEYESIGTLGPMLGVDNLVAIAECNELCNALGLDTISAGMVLAWAIECYERGVLTSAETDGLKLKWDDPEQNLELLTKIAAREGFGDVLAEGSYRAAAKLGNGADKHVMHVKKQEFPAHEPRGKWGVGLGYAVSPTGADHLIAAHDHAMMGKGDDSDEYGFANIADLSPLGILDPLPTEDLSPAKVRMFVHLQYIWSLYDVIDWCIFTNIPENRGFGLDRLVAIVKAVTGWNTSVFELMKAGERAVTMARVYNCREGLTSDDDTLPQRMFEPMREGALKGHAMDEQQFNDALELYYSMMGWDDSGVPTRAKLVELGIDWLWESQ